MLCTLASTSSSCCVGFTAGCSLQEQHACCQTPQIPLPALNKNA